RIRSRKIWRSRRGGTRTPGSGACETASRARRERLAASGQLVGVCRSDARRLTLTSLGPVPLRLRSNWVKYPPTTMFLLVFPALSAISMRKNPYVFACSAASMSWYASSLRMSSIAPANVMVFAPGEAPSIAASTAVHQLSRPSSTLAVDEPSVHVPLGHPSVFHVFGISPGVPVAYLMTTSPSRANVISALVAMFCLRSSRLCGAGVWLRGERVRVTPSHAPHGLGAGHELVDRVAVGFEDAPVV